MVIVKTMVDGYNKHYGINSAQFGTEPLTFGCFLDLLVEG